MPQQDGPGLTEVRSDLFNFKHNCIYIDGYRVHLLDSRSCGAMVSESMALKGAAGYQLEQTRVGVI